MKILQIANKFKYFLVTSATLLFVAMLVVIFCGMNKSIEYGGGTEISVKVQNQAEINQAEKLIKKVIKKNKIKIDNIAHQSNGAEFFVVFQTKQKAVKETVKTEIIEVLAGIDNVEVSDFEKIGSTYRIKVWQIVVVLVVVMVFAILIAWIRFRSFTSALSVVLSAIHAFVIGFAVLALTRVEMMTETSISLVIGSLFAAILTFLVFEKIHTDRKLLANKTKSEYELSDEAQTRQLKSDWLFFAVAGAIAILLLFTLKSKAFHLSASIFVMLVVAVYSAFCFASSFRASFATLVHAKKEKKMEKPETPVQQKAEKKNLLSKIERPVSASSKPDTKKKKRKRRNKSAKDENKIVV